MTDAMPALPERKRPIPKRVREAIRLLVEGDVKSISAAAKKVHLSREYLSRSFSQAHVSAYLLEKIQRHVAVGGARGAARMVKLVDAAKSEHVLFDSARFLLGVAGIKPASDNQASVNIGMHAAGFVIVLSEPGKPETRIVGGGEPASALPAPDSVG
jgi:hypothetical protein